MSYFQTPPEGDESQGHEAEPATVGTPAPYWAQYADEAATWEDDDASSEERPARVATRPRTAEERPRVGARLSGFGSRVRDALAGLDLGQVTRPPAFEPADPEATQAFDVLADVPAESESTGRFAVAPLGYNRTAVDEHVAALERELAELRETREPQEPAISITEEIERIGEQTASILVVAHDKAHETTRLAQEQAQRRVADARADAEAITAAAQARLEALDAETDSVWQERARLLDDARAVADEMIALIERARERFPDEVKAPETPV
ncbi:MAG TPA: DivIVA domain-containing protein [Solirubrobacteraceae bacterium]|nr:DivIVA domain-containing protein [Solirubrobacteraceae bacterium]